MSQYLSEAFKKLDLLNEDTFSVTDDGLNDFIKFEDEDEFEDTIDVIDPEADTLDDVQDSYVGKVILDCCVCHSKIYKDVEDVVIENDIANVNEECPFCYTTDGYKVIGQVASFDEEDPNTEDDSEEKKEPKEEKELEESLPVRNPRHKRVREFLPTPPTPNVSGLLEDEEQELDEFMDINLDARGFGGKDNNVSVLGGKLPVGENKDVEEGLFGFGKKKKKNIDDEEETKTSGYSDNDYIVITQHPKTGTYHYVQGTPPRKNKKNAEWDMEYINRPTNNIYGHKHEVVTYKEAKRLVGRPFRESVEELEEGIFDFGKKKKPDFYSKEEIAKRRAQREADFEKRKTDREEQERQRGAEIAKDWKDYDASKKQAKADYERDRRKNLKGSNVSNTGKAGVHYSGGDYYTEDLEESNLIKESVNNVNVETDDSVVNISTEDNGKVTVTTEPLTNVNSEGETIQPLAPEIQDEINSNVPDGEEIEIDVDEFDEASFDSLGEGYLKKVYENVNSFKTSNVSYIKDKLILEGIIKFNSGNSKKTSFVFGIREATKSGKIRFIGENKEIAKGRKSFTVTGRVENNTFLSESLNYNYGVKNTSGKTQRLYGTIKNK